MSNEVRDRFEIPKEMRSMAETGLDQARKAFEKFLANAEAAAGSIEEHGATVRAGAKDINAKATPMRRRTCRPRSTMRSRCCTPRISPK
jgi:hypothetical protein